LGIQAIVNYQASLVGLCYERIEEPEKVNVRGGFVRRCIGTCIAGKLVGQADRGRFVKGKLVLV
jgi:hypothetical protein